MGVCVSLGDWSNCHTWRKSGIWTPDSVESARRKGRDFYSIRGMYSLKVKSDHRSIFSNLSNWKEEAWKISGLQRDSNPWPPRYRCDARPAELWSHTYIFHIISLHGKVWTQEIDLAPHIGSEVNLVFTVQEKEQLYHITAEHSLKRKFTYKLFSSTLFYSALQNWHIISLVFFFCI